MMSLHSSQCNSWNSDTSVVHKLCCEEARDYTTRAKKDKAETFSLLHVVDLDTNVLGSGQMLQ